MTLVEDLKAARAMIDTPEKWLKGGHSWLMNGQWSLCLSAACQAAAKHVTGPRVFAMTNALDAALPASFSGDFIDFNDAPSTTHADVLSLIDRAIANAEQKP